MKFYGRKRVYRKRASTKKRTYKKRAGVSAGVKRYVKRTIHANIENKTHCKYSYGNYVTSYINNPSLLVQSVIPYATMTQGSHQGQRLGNVIKTRKAMFNYTLYPNRYNASTNATIVPQEVIIMIGKVKNSKPITPITTDFGKLFQEGSGASAPQSTLVDCLLAVNKDWFQVYKVLRHKVGYMAAAGTGIANTTAQQYFQNNDYKMNVIRKVDCTKWCPKTLNFNDATAQPTNDGLFFWAMCVAADGTINSQQPIFMDYVLDYTYEDA